MLNLKPTCLKNKQRGDKSTLAVKHLTLVPRALRRLPPMALITVRINYRLDLLINSPPSVSVLRLGEEGGDDLLGL